MAVRLLALVSAKQIVRISGEAGKALWILTRLAAGRFHEMQLVIDGAIGAGWGLFADRKMSKILKNNR